MLKICKKTEADENKLKELSPDKNKELDNFDFSQVIVKKPWGHEYLLYEGDGLAAWVLHIKKDSMTSMHCHVDKTTILIVLSGKVRCSSLNESNELSEGEGLIIEKKRFHSTGAISEEGAIVLEVENPVNKTDLVRLKDAYGRVLKGYESKKEMCFDLSINERVFLNEKDLNLNKRIGNMNICIKMFEDSNSLKNNLLSHKDSINIVLSGKIQDDYNNRKISGGEVLEIKNSEEVGKINISSHTKILQISKDISDFD
jgi:mannose-6-phosphate isomerase-like protein (cupin superfamily)